MTYIVEIDNPRTYVEIGKKKPKRHYLTAQRFYSGVNHFVRKAIVDVCKLDLLVASTGILKKIEEYPLSLIVEIHNEKKGKQDLDNKAYFWCKVFQDFIVERRYIKDDSVEYINDIRFLYKYSNPKLIFTLKNK